MNHDTLHGAYATYLVVVSIAIAVAAAYTALTLASLVTTSEGDTKLRWLVSGAIAMGTGIWAMHFVGMLAVHLPIPVRYDLVEVLASMLAAISASGLALFLVSRPKMEFSQLMGGSLLMGGGIAAMHYLGMAAMRLPAKLEYNLGLVGLSVFVAIAVSWIALWLTFQLRIQSTPMDNLRKLCGAIVMGLSVPGMHYIAMEGVQFVPTEAVTVPSSGLLEANPLATTVSLVTFAILGVTLLTALEAKVVDRTLALIDVNQQLESEVLEHKQTETQLRLQTVDLEQALDELKQTQMQLIQREKMSALGSMVAGVAHEISNPLGFLLGNLQPAQLYVGDLLQLVDVYQKKLPSPDQEIVNLTQAIELDYLREDLPKLLDSMKLGIDRIKNISISLRTFSRADVDHKVLCNIHDGIDSTILILKHRLKGSDQRSEIEVITHYSELPLIDCFPGQLNQVFMNLIANAIDAIEDAYSVEQQLAVEQRQPFAKLPLPTITVRTERVDDDLVLVGIADNGAGIPEAMKSHIFDQAFTTKAVGKGTGLGLAIAYQIIVDRHGGAIAVESTVGVGTEFIITLPIQTA